MRTDVPPYTNSSFYRWDNEELLRKVLKLGWYLSLPILGLYIHCLTTTKNKQGFILGNLPSRLLSWPFPHLLLGHTSSQALPTPVLNEFLGFNIQQTCSVCHLPLPTKDMAFKVAKLGNWYVQTLLAFSASFFPPLECSLYFKKKKIV